MSVISSRKVSDFIAKIPLYILLLAFSAIFLFPLYWMICTSLKDIVEANMAPPTWFPHELHWKNYWDVTQTIPFWRYTANTLFLCFASVIGTTISCAMAAYGFSRFAWPGREKFFLLTLATMMIPFPVMMVPLYAEFKAFGWIGTNLPLWVPAFFGSAYNIFLLRQFFLSIPKELSEAAIIDGCSEWGIFWKIIIPLAHPALMVVGLFCFMAVWNDFLGPLIYLMDPEQFTLALGLQQFQNKHGGTDVTLLMSAATLMILPIIILFFFTQKSFIEGISLTGMKL
ncbi:carbohydrate ABC transporter permease [Candidatus Sumerlaeota bacterium]|nr:carbohydrate ABC transporter permease [Candidatus Sumerlaeales bacterium]NLD61680.1 carbohydrate ABC transporter permease [Candidatus Sumerlaeota bacterium]